MGSAGTILDNKYKLRHLVSKGGMGEVWEAERIDLFSTVAVKLLRSRIEEKPRAHARFEREAKAAGLVGHDNVCEVLDFGVDPVGGPFLVLPLLKGRSLRQEMHAPMDVEMTCDIVTQALRGLAAIHGAGIVHRDLKPDNIFLTTLGDRQNFVKILDFGVAKFDFADQGARLTTGGAALGTPLYMAPEQARGLRDLDRRVDIYAMGLILYEMLTGWHPFQGDSHGSIAWAIWNAQVESIRKFRHDVPAQMDSVVQRAMSRDRAQRFPTAEAFSQALAEGLAAFRASGTEPAFTADTDPDNVPLAGELGGQVEPSPKRQRSKALWGLAAVPLAAVLAFVLWLSPFVSTTVGEAKKELRAPPLVVPIAVPTPLPAKSKTVQTTQQTPAAPAAVAEMEPLKEADAAPEKRAHKSAPPARPATERARKSALSGFDEVP